MKKLLLLLLLTPLVSFGQDLFFLGDSGYPCTESVNLESETYGQDLIIKFVVEDNYIRSDGEELRDTRYLIVIQTKRILKSKILGIKIYLDNGIVISKDKINQFDYIDDNVIAMFRLDWDSVIYLYNSEIDSIRYSIEGYFADKTIHLAKNKGFDTTKLFHKDGIRINGRNL